MRINNKLLRSRISGSAKHCQFLDLSGLSLDHIEGLDAFVKLQTLKLCHNNIDYVCNLECCTNIWNLDLSHNQIQNLEGLEKFLALGTLSLSGNNLMWPELARIQHMQILSLNLHSNPHLQKDPYYRLHVIDCLPNVWMLDGRIITSGERIQVEQFFNDSALGEHPVRHKLPKKRFTPSVLSQREVSGVFGEKTVHLLTRFSSVSQLNRELDWRRLRYLAYNLQEDLQLEAFYAKRWHTIVRKHPTFLEHLISMRDLDRPACNMILMLLVASLEFSIPEQLLQDTLRHAKLLTLGSVETIGLFLLPSETRCSTVSLLLSAAKVDRDSGEDGGLYDKLYLSLYFCVSELAQCIYRPTADTQVSGSKQLVDSRSLVAAEIVQLFCIVPTFFDYITKDSGVMKIVTMATGCHDMVQIVQSTQQGMEANQIRVEERYTIIADLLLSSIQKNVQDICQSRPSSHTSREHYALKTGKSIPKKPFNASLVAADYQSQGLPSPRRPLHRTTSARLERRNLCSKSADLGDRILLGPQVIGRIISIPEPDLVLVQLPEVPVKSGAMLVNLQDLSQHYAYQDLEELCWDGEANYWRLKGTKGDRITFHKIPEDKVKTRPGTASAISSSSSVRRRATVVPPDALIPSAPQSVTDCLPSVAATYKAIHQLSLVIPLNGTGQQNNDQSLNRGQKPSPENCPESEGNGERPAMVDLLGKELWSDSNGTARHPTRPNSASSDQIHGEMLTPKDESLTDQSGDSPTEEPRAGDVDPLEEAGKEETAENNMNQNNKEFESNEDGNMGQSNNNMGQEEDQTEEQADEQADEQAEEQAEDLAEDQAEEQAENQVEDQTEDLAEDQAEEQTEEQVEEHVEEPAEEIENEDSNGDNQDLREDEGNEHIAEHEDKQEEDEGNHNITEHEDSVKSDVPVGEDKIADHEDARNATGVEDNENVTEQEDSKDITESKHQQSMTELEGNETEDEKDSLQLTVSKLEGDHQSSTEVEDAQNATVECDRNENALEVHNETDGKTVQMEMASDGNVMSLSEETSPSVGEKEDEAVVEVMANESADAVQLESVVSTLPTAGSEPQSVETGAKGPTKPQVNTPRNAKPATRGQLATTVKYSTSDANKRLMVSPSDPPSWNSNVLNEGNKDLSRTEETEANNNRKNIGVRFLEPPSVLRVDQDRDRRNYPGSTRWLGEGRDLYRERIVRHPRHIPGWMEGLAFRPSTSLSAKRLMQLPGQSSSGQSSSGQRSSSLEGSQRRRIGSAPTYGRTQKLVTTFEVFDLLHQKKALQSTYYNNGGKFLQVSPSIVRGINQLQPRVVPASTSKTRALPLCRECRKKHGRGEMCFRAAFSADADDADAMPYDEFFRLHLPSPSGAEQHLL